MEIHAEMDHHSHPTLATRGHTCRKALKSIAETESGTDIETRNRRRLVGTSDLNLTGSVGLLKQNNQHLPKDLSKIQGFIIFKMSRI